MESNRRSAVVDYYDVCEGDYRLFWDLDHSLAMHAGFWDATTRNLREALVRENEVLAQTARISSSDYVLDAGCGVGGSSIFLAKTYGCHVTGITLSAKQAATAARNASAQQVEDLTHFQVSDFCQTPFADGSFDVVWGLESICHAADKAKFVQEAYRLLKKGGRLVVADGFAMRTEYSATETVQMSTWLQGWGVQSLETLSAFESHLHAQHFEQVILRDITQHVLPSSKRLFLVSFPGMVFSKFGEWLGLRRKIQTDNIKAAYYQYTTLKKGLWSYALCSAVKR